MPGAPDAHLDPRRAAAHMSPPHGGFFPPHAGFPGAPMDPNIMAAGTLFNIFKKITIAVFNFTVA